MVESNTFHKWESDEAAVAAIPHFARAHGVEEEEEVAGFFGRLPSDQDFVTPIEMDSAAAVASAL